MSGRQHLDNDTIRKLRALVDTRPTADEAENVAISGSMTAAGGFVGDLTGDVTGDVTGNADTATNTANVSTKTAAQVVTGVDAGNAAKAVTDAATSANTASTVVKRDASGNFSAGTITASLSGNATSSTDGAAAKAATDAATSANTASTIVKRDSAGAIAIGQLSNAGILIESSSVAPSALAAGETALLTPASATRHLRVSGTTASFLCSMAAGSSMEVRTIENVGTVPVTLGHEETTTTAGVATTATDRFKCPGGLPFILWPGDAVDALYDTVLASARWRVLGRAAARGPSFLPGPRDIVAALAFTPDGLYPHDDVAAGARDAYANGLLTVNATPTWNDWRGKYRGVFMDAAADYFAANLHDAANASQLAICLFSMIAHDGATRQLVGRNANNGEPLLDARILSDDKVYVYIDDGAGHAANTNAIGGAAITAGDLYALGYQLDRAAAKLRTQMDDVTTGTTGLTATDVSTTSYATLAGGTSPVFAEGFFNGLFWGNNLWYGGTLVFSGAQIEGANALGNILHRLGTR